MYNWRNGGDIREGRLVLIYAVAARCLVITRAGRRQGTGLGVIYGRM